MTKSIRYTLVEYGTPVCNSVIYEPNGVTYIQSFIQHQRFSLPGWIVLELYLFDVEEVLGVKGDGSAGHRNVLIQSTTVADIGPHSKCYCFSL